MKPALKRKPDGRPPVLLTMADYLGTLAAARALGSSGIPVIVADSHRLGATRWSRHVVEVLECPDVESEPRAFVKWLEDMGARKPGGVLCATSDCLAWLFALNREALLSHYHLFIPPFEAAYALLNKWKLYQRCVALGIDAPRTFLAANDEDVEKIRSDAQFPVLVKPQTQCFLLPHQKGRLVSGPEELDMALRDFRQSTTYATLLTERDPAVHAPMVQEFVTDASAGIYNLSGFIDASGQLFVVQASRKLLQWPLRFGVGLCFEEVDVLPKVAESVSSLCRSVGYFGTFEVEFVPSHSRQLLIDFNPRFFGQMGFDISRGLNLPLMTYLGALGRSGELSAEVGAAKRRASRSLKRVYCNRVELEVVLSLLRLAGRIDKNDYQRWRDWLRAHRHEQTDPLIDGDDWLPGALGALSAVLTRVAHPRSTWRAAREW